MTELAVIARWHGPIDVDEGAGVDGWIVGDDDAYDRLLARLPAFRVQMRQPAPTSDDPLRTRPPIDFGAHMLVVVSRAGSMAPVTIARVEQEAGAVVVRFVATPPPPEARPFGVGRYAAALIARVAGTLELRGPRVIDDAAAVEGAVGELVTLRGELARTRIPTLLGVDVEQGEVDDGLAEATGWLEREVVDPRELDEVIAQRGQVAHRGPGTFHRLVALDGAGLAPARQRW